MLSLLSSKSLQFRFIVVGLVLSCFLFGAKLLFLSTSEPLRLNEVTSTWVAGRSVLLDSLSRHQDSIALTSFPFTLTDAERKKRLEAESAALSAAGLRGVSANQQEAPTFFSSFVAVAGEIVSDPLSALEAHLLNAPFVKSIRSWYREPALSGRVLQAYPLMAYFYSFLGRGVLPVVKEASSLAFHPRNPSPAHRVQINSSFITSELTHFTHSPLRRDTVQEENTPAAATALPSERNSAVFFMRLTQVFFSEIPLLWCLLFFTLVVGQSARKMANLRWSVSVSRNLMPAVIGGAGGEGVVSAARSRSEVVWNKKTTNSTDNGGTKPKVLGLPVRRQAALDSVTSGLGMTSVNSMDSLTGGGGMEEEEESSANTPRHKSSELVSRQASLMQRLATDVGNELNTETEEDETNKKEASAATGKTELEKGKVSTTGEKKKKPGVAPRTTSQDSPYDLNRGFRSVQKLSASYQSQVNSLGAPGSAFLLVAGLILMVFFNPLTLQTQGGIRFGAGGSGYDSVPYAAFTLAVAAVASNWLATGVLLLCCCLASHQDFILSYGIAFGVFVVWSLLRKLMPLAARRNGADKNNSKSKGDRKREEANDQKVVVPFPRRFLSFLITLLKFVVVISLVASISLVPLLISDAHLKVGVARFKYIAEKGEDVSLLTKPVSFGDITNVLFSSSARASKTTPIDLLSDSLSRIWSVNLYPAGGYYPLTRRPLWASNVYALLNAFDVLICESGVLSKRCPPSQLNVKAMAHHYEYNHTLERHDPANRLPSELSRYKPFSILPLSELLRNLNHKRCFICSIVVMVAAILFSLHRRRSAAARPGGVSSSSTSSIQGFSFSCASKSRTKESWFHCFSLLWISYCSAGGHFLFGFNVSGQGTELIKVCFPLMLFAILSLVEMLEAQRHLRRTLIWTVNLLLQEHNTNRLKNNTTKKDSSEDDDQKGKGNTTKKNTQPIIPQPSLLLKQLHLFAVMTRRVRVVIGLLGSIQIFGGASLVPNFSTLTELSLVAALLVGTGLLWFALDSIICFDALRHMEAAGALCRDTNTATGSTAPTPQQQCRKRGSNNNPAEIINQRKAFAIRPLMSRVDWLVITVLLPMSITISIGYQITTTTTLLLPSGGGERMGAQHHHQEAQSPTTPFLPYAHMQLVVLCAFFLIKNIVIKGARVCAVQ